MGTWAAGPFDNDRAADWAGELDDTEPADRAELVRDTLADAADGTDYLQVDVAEAAIAAAAVLAATLPGGPEFDSGYAPKLLVADPPLVLPDDLVPLALQALDRVAADESEWRELWEDNGNLDAALTALIPVREALGG